MGKIRGQTDDRLRQIVDALQSYESNHPKAKVDAYRQYEFAVRLRIIDPDFKGIGLAKRHEKIWRILEDLPVDLLNDVTQLVLVTPAEARKSGANYEFEHPTPCPPELLDLIEKNTRRNGRKNADR